MKRIFVFAAAMTMNLSTAFAEPSLIPSVKVESTSYVDIRSSWGWGVEGPTGKTKAQAYDECQKMLQNLLASVPQKRILGNPKCPSTEYDIRENGSITVRVYLMPN